MPTVLRGIGIGGATGYGPVARMARPPVPPAPRTVPPDEAPAEAAAVRAALEGVAAALDRRAAAAAGPAADVLSAQALMVTDPALGDRAQALARDGADGPRALTAAFGEFRAALQAVGGLFAERVADLDDLRDRAIAQLLGLPMPGLPDPGYPYVLVADDLAPADTALLDPARVIALVTEQGGPTSHTAILARGLGVPAIVGCAGADALTDGQAVLVDGAAGTVEAEPSPEAVEAAVLRERRRLRAAELTGPGRTADGHPVTLLVNLGAPRELGAAAAADSEGVGLFRTEFLFLDRAEAPSLAEQTDVYARVFAAFAGRRVVVRTLDAGADKPLPFAPTGADEQNPALGIRGLRTAARDPGLLDDQLLALARAARGSTAEVWVMAPMVSLPAEAAAFAERVRAHGLPTAGAMVEVPAAALRADELAGGCDFLSIGTNDLSQYIFAADRTLAGLADLLDPWQPALLDLVQLTARAGARHGRPVGVCGESAADPALALVLTGLGVTSLSAAPAALPDVRAALATHTLADCRELADLARTAPDAATARSRVRERLALDG